MSRPFAPWEFRACSFFLWKSGWWYPSLAPALENGFSFSVCNHINVLCLKKSSFIQHFIVQVWKAHLCTFMSINCVSLMCTLIRCSYSALLFSFVIYLLVFSAFCFLKHDSVLPGINCWTFGRTHHQILYRFFDCSAVLLDIVVDGAAALF